MNVPRGAVEAQVEGLRSLGMEELRTQWRQRWGAPPPVRSSDFLRRLLAERIQLEAYGHDPELERRIAKLVTAHRRGRPPSAPRQTFKPGTLLVREHAGVTHRVEVLPSGFRWQGEVYGSLSEVARQITGVRWSGPLFFGLRERAA